MVLSMPRAFSKAAVILLLVSVAVPVSLLAFSPAKVVSSAAPAPCHQDMPGSDGPALPNHDCCLLGHNHAIPANAPHLPTLQVAGLPLLVPVLLVMTSGQRETALSSFDPPPAILPLRI